MTCFPANHLAHLVALMLVLWAPVIVVGQSSSCSTATKISAPYSTSMEPIQDFISSSITGLCDTNSISTATSNLLSAGRWFSYTPSASRIAKIVIQATDDGYPPITAIFKGPCDSLTCVDDSIYVPEKFLDAQAGNEYFVFVYRDAEYSGDGPFSLSIDEIEPPVNDNIENAVPLASQDLPFRSGYTLYGAHSDFELDACALYGDTYGVWFKYNSTSFAEKLSLQVTTGLTNDAVGIQVRDGSRFTCVARGSTFAAPPIEWIAEANLLYYILAIYPSVSGGSSFELKLQSLGPVTPPTSTSSPDQPISAPDEATKPPTSTSSPDQPISAPDEATNTASPVPVPDAFEPTSLEPLASYGLPNKPSTVIAFVAMVLPLQIFS